MNILDPCPASIWLFGAAVQCSKERGHEGMHEVTIRWAVE